MNASRQLTILLRCVGGCCLLAVVGVFLPRDMMVSIHESAGLGGFPREPIAEYLARSTSALCALYGGLLCLIAGDVRRYRMVIAFQAVGIMVCSLAGVCMTTGTGRLWWFVLLDAILCWAYSVPVLLLLRRIKSNDFVE